MEIPTFLIEMLNSQYGEEITNKVLSGYKGKRAVTCRVNTLKSNLEEVAKVLREKNIEFETVPWYKDALIIKNANEKDLSGLSIYENGEIYLQSLSSMLPPIILEPQEKENILDMAAAPGSKTTQIAAISNNKAYITACEMNAIRAERLKYNIDKQGVSSVYVMVKDARKLDDMFSFDKILLDAPCSGSGTISEDNKNLDKTFTLNLINKSSNTQKALLKKALKLLKPGGELIYSTCSILESENEKVVIEVLKGTKAEIVPIQFKGIEDVPCLPVKIPGTICVCPNDLFEGFFIAKIRLLK